MRHFRETLIADYNPPKAKTYIVHIDLKLTSAQKFYEIVVVVPYVDIIKF